MPADLFEQRLTELEVKLAFIDEAVQALTVADVEQAQRQALLERQLADLRRELATLRTAQEHDPHDEPPPPHY